MKKKTSSKVSVALSCSVCGARNYKASRPRRDGTPVLTLSKFCKTCNAHTLHRESK
ncbi:MAG: 50S ribosomal protein L33 [Polyangiaceae bacterium]|nr:50S ribosomal protein L33 [Polyangiaceae bacterium]